jgi:hypothetical protein
MSTSTHRGVLLRRRLLAVGLVALALPVMVFRSQHAEAADTASPTETTTAPGAPTTVPPTTASITVSPATDLQNPDGVLVIGSGFPAGGFGDILECYPGPPVSCMRPFSPPSVVTADATGAFSFPFPVSAQLHTTTCTSQCFIKASVGGVSASAPIEFRVSATTTAVPITTASTLRTTTRPPMSTTRPPTTATGSTAVRPGHTSLWRILQRLVCLLFAVGCT